MIDKFFTSDKSVEEEDIDTFIDRLLHMNNNNIETYNNDLNAVQTPTTVR